MHNLPKGRYVQVFVIFSQLFKPIVLHSFVHHTAAWFNGQPRINRSHVTTDLRNFICWKSPKHLIGIDLLVLEFQHISERISQLWISEHLSASLAISLTFTTLVYGINEGQATELAEVERPYCLRVKFQSSFYKHLFGKGSRVSMVVCGFVTFMKINGNGVPLRRRNDRMNGDHSFCGWRWMWACSDTRPQIFMGW